jgi:hypothetical protein
VRERLLSTKQVAELRGGVTPQHVAEIAAAKSSANQTRFSEACLAAWPDGFLKIGRQWFLPERRFNEFIAQKG